jgi:hypothetical protein
MRYRKQVSFSPPFRAIPLIFGKVFANYYLAFFSASHGFCTLKPPVFVNILTTI